MENVIWYGQGSLRIETGTKVVYIDPLWIEEDRHDADVILITHYHFDHLSEEDIAKVLKKEKTIFGAPENCVEQIKKSFQNEIIVIKPGEKHFINEVNIQAIAAYNIRKVECHPKENEWLGYIVETRQGKYYYAGDTERIPEMDGLEADVAFVPLGQTYTFDSVQEAVDAVKATTAKVAVPVHWGEYEGTSNDVHIFKMLLYPDVEVAELKRMK